MKKIILIFCFAFLASSSYAQLLFQETFDYTAGDSIGAHGWQWNTGTTNTILVTSPSLTYPGYPFSGIGNATTLKPTGNDAYKELGGSDSTGSFYASFLVRVDSAKAQGDYFLALLQAGSTGFYEGRVQAAFRNGGLAFGITKGNASTDTAVAGAWTPGIYSLETTYLLVLKYTFVPGGSNNDQVSLFVFSSGVPATEPAPTLGPNTYPSLDATAIGRVALRQGGGSGRAPYCVVDGIRVSKFWMPSVWNVKVAVQGLYNTGTGQLNKRDTVAVYLHSTVSPYPVIDSSKAVIDSVSLSGTYTFGNAADGNYFLVVRYRNMDIFRNGITTWSKAGGEVLTRLDGSYDFTSSASQAFGNNQILMGSIYATYNGDQNQDNIVDITDVINVYNANTTFLTGYVNQDMNGDNQVTLADVLITFNNSANFVEVKAPTP